MDDVKMLQPPRWPHDSVASLSDVHGWPAGDLKALAGLTAEFVLEQGRLGGPLTSGTPNGLQWMTNGSRAARASASEAYERARTALAVGGASEALGTQAALMQLLSCAKGDGTNDRHGGYMAYAPTAALFEGALAAFGCAAINPGLTWMPTSPKFAAMERAVLDWAATAVLRWPASNGGVFTSGGSVANSLGLHVARDTVATRAGCRLSEVLFFVPEHVHYCIPKGLRVLGVDTRQIIRIPCGNDGRTDIRALDNILCGVAGEIKNGAGVVIGVGGETSTGHVDALDSLADLCVTHGNLWLHVDACFGGFFTLTTRGAALLRGIERANSAALDPHKALQAPYGVGMLMIRDETHLRSAFSMSAAYVPPVGSGQNKHDVTDISDLGLELTREARGAQVWLPLRAYGAQAFATHLDWCQDAVRWLASTLSDTCPLIDLVTEPHLSTMTFRLKASFQNISQKEVAQWLVDDVNARGRVLLAPTTTASGIPCVRICVLSARSRPEHLTALAEDVIAAAIILSECLSDLERSREVPDRGFGFHVPYEVRPLPGKGLRVVARDEIPAGTLVWAGAGDNLHLKGDAEFFKQGKEHNLSPADGHRWLASRVIYGGEELLLGPGGPSAKLGSTRALPT